MNLKSAEDKRSVVKHAISILEKQSVAERTDFDKPLAEKDIRNVLNNLTTIEVFDFFPFEIMTIEMIAEFIVNNLLSRRYSYNKIYKDDSVEDNNPKKTTENKEKEAKKPQFRQIMNNLKGKKYHLLWKDGIIDTFIVGVNELAEELRTEHIGNAPNYVGNDLRSHLLIYLNRNGLFSDNLVHCRPVCYNIISEIAKNFQDFYNPIVGVYECLENPSFQDLYYLLQMNSTTIIYIEQMIRHSIYFCVIINDRFSLNDKKNVLNQLKKWAINLRNQYLPRINQLRIKNIQMHKNDPSLLSIDKLSLRFAYYLDKIAEYDFLKVIKDKLSKDNTDYENETSSDIPQILLFDKDIYDIFLSGNSGQEVKEIDKERAKWLAMPYYFNKHCILNDFNVDLKESDFLYMTKPFHSTLVSKAKPTGKSMKKISSNMESGKKNIEDETAYFAELDRQHFIHLNTLGLYSLFNEVLFEFYKTIEKSYLTLNTKDSILLLCRFFETYLEFFNNIKISDIEF